MYYNKFLLYNEIGVVAYFFENIKLLQENFEIVVLAIIFISIVLRLIPVVKSKFLSN